MSLSIGTRILDNVDDARDIGLTCSPADWNELPTQMKNIIQQRRGEILQLYSERGPYAHYFNNIRRNHRNFLTMHFLQLYEAVLGWQNNPTTKQLNCSATRKSFTAADIHDMSADNTVATFVPGMSNSGDTANRKLVFRVVEISRGVAAIDKIAENTRARHAIQNLSNIALSCTMDAKHKIVVMKNISANTYDIITNRPIDSFWQRLLPSLLLSEEQLAAVGEAPYGENTPESQMRTFCRMLYENRLEEYMEYLGSLTANLTNLMQQQVYKKLDNIISTLAEKQERTILENINTCERKIEDYHNAAQEYLNQLREHNLRLTGLLINKKAETEQLTTTFSFIKEHPEIIKLVDVDTSNSTLSLRIKTHIGNWRTKDAEMWFKRSEENYVNRNPKVAAAFKACFVDETFEMLTETLVSFRPSTNSNHVATGHNVWDNAQELLQNVHIGRYNCFSNYKNALQKALQAQDYYQALMLIIQACATYTFTDSAVVSTLTNNMRACTGKTYREKGTGALCTLEELYAKVTNTTIPNTIEPEPLF